MNMLLRAGAFLGLVSAGAYFHSTKCHSLRKKHSELEEKILLQRLLRSTDRVVKGPEGFKIETENIIKNKKQLEDIEQKTNCLLCKIWPQPKIESQVSSILNEESEIVCNEDILGMQYAPKVWNTEDNIFACTIGSSIACQYIAERSLKNASQFPKDIQQSLKEIKAKPSKDDSVYFGIRREHPRTKRKKKAQMDEIHAFAPRLIRLSHELEEVGHQLKPCLSDASNLAKTCNGEELSSHLNNIEDEILTLVHERDKKTEEMLVEKNKAMESAKMRKTTPGNVNPNQEEDLKEQHKMCENLGKAEGLKQVNKHLLLLENSLETHLALLHAYQKNK